MRLTLRTMLAYLDDILDPEDAQQLGKKITESDFASDLVYRTLNSKRRTNLTAPRLDGTGIGSDPNSVAEYLDNTLDESRIPEFERICLESEMHLGEVASCHSILTKVMEESIEVKPQFRTSLIGLLEARHKKSDPVEEVPTQPERIQSQKTAEYLPSETHPLWRVLVILTFLTLVTIIGLRALGPLDETHRILGPLFQGPVESEDTDLDLNTGIDRSVREPLRPAAPTADQVGTDQRTDSPLSLTTPAGNGAVESIGNIVAGEFLADHQLLVAHSGNLSAVRRLVSAAPIVSGTTYLTFASYRPEISMRSGVRMMFVGASEFTIGQTATGQTEYQLHNGCLVLRAEEERPSMIALKIGDRQIDVYLGDRRSIFTAQVTSCSPITPNTGERVIQFHCGGIAQWRERGAPPVVEQANRTVPIIRAYTVIGSASTEVTAEETLPRWVTGDSQNAAMEQEAARSLTESLASDSDLRNGLRKAFESHRLLKVRVLAANGLLQLGDPNAILDTLNHEEYRSTWELSIQAIGRYVLRGTNERQQVSEALQTRVGDHAELYLSMLGFLKDEELHGDTGSAMIRGLESTVMLERVISFQRLKIITGKTHMYEPERSSQRQIVAIRRWQQLWSEKALRNTEPFTAVSYLIP